jgi:hypothetical protein
MRGGEGGPKTQTALPVARLSLDLRVHRLPCLQVGVLFLPVAAIADAVQKVGVDGLPVDARGETADSSKELKQVVGEGRIVYANPHSRSQVVIDSVARLPYRSDR